MAKIRYFKLSNDGWYVALMRIEYKNVLTVGDNVAYDAKWSSWEAGGYHDVCLGAERTVDLTDTDIGKGAQVRLHMVVAGGKDRTADQVFEYSDAAGATAFYKASRTTLDSLLEFRGAS
jgi:hypothetical protein